MWTMLWPYHTGALFPSNSMPDNGATATVTVKVADGQLAVGPGGGRPGPLHPGQAGPGLCIVVLYRPAGPGGDDVERRRRDG